MNTFRSQLLRLKESLGLAEDQEVASALGMAATAFSARKTRNSFPESRVVAAKARYPDLDVHYVLTGHREVGHAALVIDQMNRHAASNQGPDGQALAAKAMHLAASERREAASKENQLMGLLPWVDEDGIDLLIRLAARMAGTSKRRG